MKKRLLKDTWFQMFAAVGGVAYVVSALGSATARHESLPPPAAPAAVSAPAPAAAAPADRAFDDPGSYGAVTPPAPASSDLATYSGVTAAARDPSAMVMGPAASVPSTPPKFTLTGSGVGNTQGIVGAPAGGLGGINSLLNSLMGAPQAAQAPTAQAARAALPAPLRVAPSRVGIFTVGPAGTAGVDTSSLRDAVFSASDGDLILVKPGSYEGPVDVANKSVRIRGTGSYPGAVTVSWTGPGATISVRNGGLRLEKVLVERGSHFEYPKTEPGGAVYGYASALTLRDVQVNSNDSSAPPLIVEQGGGSAKLTVEDVRLTGSSANVLIRGAVKAKFTRTTFDAYTRPLAAWIDSAVELVDCRFLDTTADIVILAYEGARVTVTGKQKPRIVTTRGAEATGYEDSFGVKRPGIARGGFARDIFRRGRRAGTLP
ncbi:MAG: hypothetical protein HYV14_08730 [Elusimicrobia bacterium]|nr:hypothetical protein [Elusimicrobiota bacterium]